MKFKFSTPVLVAALALSGAAVFQTQAQAQSAPTTFHCVKSGSGFATVARRGGKQSPPMITWQSYIFGPEYTPEVRCNNVSQRLTSAVAQNGGSLRNLLLTTGKINGQTVICYINVGAPRCNGSNMLFTLNPENARDPGTALASILRFGAGTGGGPLRQSESGDEEPTVELQSAVDEAFAAGERQSAGPDEDNNVSPNPSESIGGGENNPGMSPSTPSNPESSGGQGGGVW